MTGPWIAWGAPLALAWWQSAAIGESTGASGQAFGQMTYVSMLLRLFVYLIVICGGLYVAAKWIVPRLTRWRLARGSPVTLIDQFALGKGRSICVVKVLRRYYLMGVTDGSVRLLTELDASEVEAAYPTSARGEQRPAAEKGGGPR